MSTALTPQNHGLPSPADWTTMMQMAEAMYRSGLLPPSIKSPQAAVLLVQKGRELGIAPTYALSNIVVIQGKPTANAELMLALIYRDHGDDAVTFSEATDKKATIAYKRRSWKERQTFSYTIEEAQKAGLLSNQTWQKYPGAMLRARCISAVARLAFPDSIGGMYTPEELGAAVAMDDATGEMRIVEGQVVNTSTGEIQEPVAPPPATLPKLERALADINNAKSVADLTTLWLGLKKEKWGSDYDTIHDAVAEKGAALKAVQEPPTIDGEATEVSA